MPSMSPPKLIESLLTCGSATDFAPLLIRFCALINTSRSATVRPQAPTYGRRLLLQWLWRLFKATCGRDQKSRSLFPSRLCCTSKQLTGIITDPGHCYRCLASNWTVDTGPIQHGLMIRLTLNDIGNCRYRSELSRHTLLTAQEQDVQA